MMLNMLNLLNNYVECFCWWIQGRDRTLKTGFAKMSRAWSPLKIWRCQSVADASPEEWKSEDNDSTTCPVNSSDRMPKRKILTLDQEVGSCCVFWYELTHTICDSFYFEEMMKR